MAGRTRMGAFTSWRTAAAAAVRRRASGAAARARSGNAPSRASRRPEVIEVKSPAELEPGVASASPEPTFAKRADRPRDPPG